MKKYRITQESIFSGEWFLREDNAPQIHGTLSWDLDRASLKLNGAFRPLRGPFYGYDGSTYAAVHGTTTESELVTLLQAMTVGSGFNIGPNGMRESETLVSSCIIVGAHVNPATEYSEVSSRIPGMQLWIGRSGVSRTVIDRQTGCNGSVVFQVEHLPEETIEITDIKAQIGWGFENYYSGDLMSEISVSISAHVTIRPLQPKTLDWYLEQFGKLTTLLSLISGSPMAQDHISAKVAQTDSDVQVLVSLRQPSCCEYKNQHEFYMLRNGMEIDLGSAFKKWIAAYDAIETPSQLALNVLNSKGLWPHVEFLSLMQALEGFHRAIHMGQYVSREEYEAVALSLNNAIPKNVKADLKDSLKARIRYGNEVSLRKRLDELVAPLSDVLRKPILGESGKIPRTWIDTRNYYTHWDENSRNSILQGRELHQAHVRIRHLLRVLYLRFVGIPESAIVRSLENGNSEAQYLIQINNEVYRKNNPGKDAGAFMHIMMNQPGPATKPSE